jgi:DNA-binding transcriptional MerR regulator
MSLLNDFMTIHELSAETGIPLHTLRHYRAVNSGPVSYRIAGRVVYPRQAVTEWLTAQMAATVRGGQ